MSGVEMDFDAMMKHKDKAVRGLTGGIEHLFKKYKVYSSPSVTAMSTYQLQLLSWFNLQVDYVKGKGKITAKDEVSVALNAGGEKVLKTKNILIATGSEVEYAFWYPLHSNF